VNPEDFLGLNIGTPDNYLPDAGGKKGGAAESSDRRSAK